MELGPSERGGLETLVAREEREAERLAALERRITETLVSSPPSPARRQPRGAGHSAAEDSSGADALQRRAASLAKQNMAARERLHAVRALLEEDAKSVEAAAWGGVAPDNADAQWLPVGASPALAQAGGGGGEAGNAAAAAAATSSSSAAATGPREVAAAMAEAGGDVSEWAEAQLLGSAMAPAPAGAHSVVTSLVEVCRALSDRFSHATLGPAITSLLSRGDFRGEAFCLHGRGALVERGASHEELSVGYLAVLGDGLEFLLSSRAAGSSSGTPSRRVAGATLQLPFSAVERVGTVHFPFSAPPATGEGDARPMLALEVALAGEAAPHVFWGLVDAAAFCHEVRAAFSEFLAAHPLLPPAPTPPPPPRLLPLPPPPPPSRAESEAKAAEKPAAASPRAQMYDRVPWAADDAARAEQLAGLARTEAELRVLMQPWTTSWRLVTPRSLAGRVELFVHEPRGAPLVTMCSFTLDAPPELAFIAFHRPHLRLEWEAHALEYRVLQRLSPRDDVVYRRNAGALGNWVAGRDFINARRVAAWGPGAMCEVYHGLADHPLAPQPRDTVRGLSLTSGAVFEAAPPRRPALSSQFAHTHSPATPPPHAAATQRWARGDEPINAARRCRVTMVAQQAARGWIPQRAVDRAVVSLLAQAAMLLSAFVARNGARLEREYAEWGWPLGQADTEPAAREQPPTLRDGGDTDGEGDEEDEEEDVVAAAQASDAAAGLL
jgi:hypothetical protein